MKKVIKELCRKRLEYYKEREDSYNEETDEYTVPWNTDIDKLAEAILENIKIGFDKLEMDFILDQLAHLGQAPSLIYDDNGHWAISSVGFQSVSISDMPEDFEASMFVEEKAFADTPKEALRIYLFSDE